VPPSGAAEWEKSECATSSPPCWPACSLRAGPQSQYVEPPAQPSTSARSRRIRGRADLSQPKPFPAIRPVATTHSTTTRIPSIKNDGNADHYDQRDQCMKQHVRHHLLPVPIDSVASSSLSRPLAATPRSRDARGNIPQTRGAQCLWAYRAGHKKARRSGARGHPRNWSPIGRHSNGRPPAGAARRAS
jgi:hypothetical protein